MTGIIMIALGVYAIGLLPASFMAMDSYNDWCESELIASVVLWPITLAFITAHGVLTLWERYKHGV